MKFGRDNEIRTGQWNTDGTVKYGRDNETGQWNMDGTMEYGRDNKIQMVQ